MDLIAILTKMYFGVEFEFCVCLINDEEGGEIWERKQRYFSLLQRLMGRDEVGAWELSSVPHEKGDYSKWSMVDDASIHCGFKQLAQGFGYPEEESDEESEEEEGEGASSNMLERLKQRLGSLWGAGGSSRPRELEEPAEEPLEPPFEKRRRRGPGSVDMERDTKRELYIKTCDTGVILTGRGIEGYREFWEKCGHKIFPVEVVSKKYEYSQLAEFGEVVGNCIYNDSVVYEKNTSQGLHINIGAPKNIMNLVGGEMAYLNNFINLWHRFERQILLLVPAGACSVEPGAKKYTEYAQPLGGRFRSREQLNEVVDGYPAWARYYARHRAVPVVSATVRLVPGSPAIQGLEPGVMAQVIEVEGEDIYLQVDAAETYGPFHASKLEVIPSQAPQVPYDEKPKYTTANIKGIFSDLSPDGAEIGLSLEKPWVEFRFLPPVSLDLMESWITLLSSLSTIALNQDAYERAMRGKLNLGDMFTTLQGLGVSGAGDLGRHALDALKQINEGKRSQIVYSYHDYSLAKGMPMV